MCVLSRHTFFREREREKERIFLETLNVQQAKKKRKERKEEKKRGAFFWGPPPEKRRTLSFCESLCVVLFNERRRGTSARSDTHTHRECVSERVCFALEKESGCKRGRVLLEGEKEREEKVSWGESAKKSIVLERACCCFIEEVR